MGFGKQAHKFGEMMNAPVVFGNKTRRGHDEKAEMLDIVGQVHGKNVLIVDDFTISGGTLCEMAVACKQLGAKDVYACVSHGVFSKGSAAKIARSPIKELVLTDTIEHRFEPLAPCCKVVSIASPFADAIISIHRRESVSRLFHYWESEPAPSPLPTSPARIRAFARRSVSLTSSPLVPSMMIDFRVTLRGSIPPGEAGHDDDGSARDPGRAEVERLSNGVGQGRDEEKPDRQARGGRVDISRTSSATRRR